MFETSLDTDRAWQDRAWTAFDTRDRTADGTFVVAVRTTGIYCKPSCPARRPRRENVAFLHDAAAARAAGFRACRRCLPDSVARDHEAVMRATAMIAAQGSIALATLAAAVDYAPHHFHRLFKRATGVTPAAYARALRSTRAEDALQQGTRVTSAIYDAGYAAPSRFYADAARIGMAPGVTVRGGAGVTIRWTIVATSLGALLIATTHKGPCRVAFDEDAVALARRFPAATIEPADPVLAASVARIAARVESPDRDAHLPDDVRATAFRECVWQAMAAMVRQI